MKKLFKNIFKKHTLIIEPIIKSTVKREVIEKKKLKPVEKKKSKSISKKSKKELDSPLTNHDFECLANICDYKTIKPGGKTSNYLKKCVTKDELIKILEKKFNTLPEITKSNIKIFIKHNNLTFLKI
jgi:hypothetical protein